VRFGAFVPQGWRQELTGIDDPVEQYETLTRCALEAEAAGYDSVWVYDHFHTIPKPELKPTFEAWTTMAGLARDTKRVRLGQMVTCNEYRPPALLAKMASCVDVMSGGRAVVGLGAGWYEQEFNAYGYEFRETPERLRRLGESLQVFKAMWGEEHASFEGQHYQLRGAINEPKPVQRPHPPLWVGGGGERVTLKLVARYADGCNFGGDSAAIRHKLEVLERHCEAVGRDSAEITKSTSVEGVIFGDEREVARQIGARSRAIGVDPDVLRAQLGPLAGPAEQVAEELRARVAAGIDYVIVFLAGLAEGGQLQRFADEVIPLVG
jgi:F420-dependent oxidoreductase-like protein